MNSLRIAIVVQRYGLEVNGGAEDLARAVAEHLAILGEVHVLTTCALSYTTWANEYQPGESELNGVHVHRFMVDQSRNWNRAMKETGLFWLSDRSLAEQMNWVRANGPFSTPLLQYIKQSETDFAVFIFFTYVYATTFFGLPLVAHKAVLVPTAHDEPFLYKDVYRALLHLPRHIIYLTEAEREIVHQVTGNGRIPNSIAAMGITPPSDVSGSRFRQKHNIEGDFLLYGGRIASGKNVPQLLDYFLRYRQDSSHPIKLVLMGKSDLTIPQHTDIIPIGFVSEKDKYDALQAATAVIQPSLYESLSIIILEAWLMKKPVIVHGQCAVTKQQCNRSNGGLYYSSYDEFNAILTRFIHSPLLQTALGQQGQQFVTTTYNWETVISQYQTILGLLNP